MSHVRIVCESGDSFYYIHESCVIHGIHLVYVHIPSSYYAHESFGSRVSRGTGVFSYSTSYANGVENCSCPTSSMVPYIHIISTQAIQDNIHLSNFVSYCLG